MVTPAIIQIKSSGKKGKDKVKNNINPDYPDIIWFKQGEYVITSFTTSQTINNYTINIQGKDKMALLNGELGGAIPSLTWDFGVAEHIDSYGNTVKEKIPIKDIITSAVHQFSNEPLYKIIVNDLEERGLELLEYRGKEPMYILLNKDYQEYHNATLSGEAEYTIDGTGERVQLKNIPIYNPLFDLEQNDATEIYPTVIKDDSNIPLTVAKIEYGMSAGYRETDLVYAGDLIMQVGQSITMMLDKIVAMLGDFEYFFDLDGNFIFRKKPTYINLSWNNIVNNLDEEYVENAAYTSAYSYSFEDGVQIISYSNNPNFANLRNDFTVWGERRGVGGASIPIHMRFAVDQKPFLFVNSEKKIYTTLTENPSIGKTEITNFLQDYYMFREGHKDTIESFTAVYDNLDWREIIYQMALDYNKHHLDEDYYLNLYNNNYELYPYGRTGYEQYYVDLEGFWRTLYCPSYSVEDIYEIATPTKTEYLNNYTKYYYNAPNYTSNREEPYHSNINYYKEKYSAEKDAKVMTLVNITRLDYEEAQSSDDSFPYYWIDFETPYVKQSCKIIEPYRESGTGYYDANGISISKSITREDYEKVPQEYYYCKGRIYLPCSGLELFASNQSYYYVNENNSYVLARDLTKGEYENNPSKYYRRTYEYIQCSKSSVYDSTETYYTKVYNRNTKTETYAKVSDLNLGTFEKNPEKYYTQGSLVYQSCLTLLEDYYENRKYFIRNSNGVYEATSFRNRNEYLINTNNNNVFYESISYECCVHPIDYTTLSDIYIINNEKYDSQGWNPDIVANPENLNFWFDFLNENSELQKYGNHIIGNRPKAINDTQVKAIYFRETPTVIFVNGEKDSQEKLGYTYLNIPNSMESLFSISGQGKSAKSVIDQFMYQYAQNAETINLTMIPMYYLEPNTRVFIRNDESGIEGEYIVNRISLALSSNGNMTVVASKAVDRLF